MQLNVFRAWQPEYNSDWIASLSKSKCSVLRTIGAARKSILVSQLMTPMSNVSELLFWTLFWSMMITYVVCVLFCVGRRNRWNVDALYAILAAFGVLWAIVFFLSYRCRKLLYTPDVYLALPPWQDVRRGCLIEPGSGRQAWDAATSTCSVVKPSSLLGSKVTLFNFFSKKDVFLGDFETRNMPYRARSILHAFSVLLTAIAQGLRPSIDEAAFIGMRLTSLAFAVYLTFEALVSMAIGQQYTLSFYLLHKVRAWRAKRSGNRVLEPFDPRATVVQNLAFSMMLALGTAGTFLIQFEEGAASTCPALWVLPVVTSLLIIVVTQVGVQYSCCPGSFIVGLLVSSGLLQKPVDQFLSERTLLLTYGTFGPVLELQPPELSPSSPPRRCSCLGAAARRCSCRSRLSASCLPQWCSCCACWRRCALPQCCCCCACWRSAPGPEPAGL